MVAENKEDARKKVLQNCGLVMKSATVGWVIGYISDDVLLTINALLPDFIKDLVNTVTNGIKQKIGKLLGVNVGVDEHNKDDYN